MLPFPDTLRYHGRVFTALWPWETWQVYINDDETQLIFVSSTDAVAYLLDMPRLSDEMIDIDRLMTVFREKRVRIPGNGWALFQNP
ncbi:hypothetical protein SAMN00768000_3640 [Sulfobacillus thermosulfidooxidans DSM 9293]|uniref:Uncharacterized protein n=2 Tax=Sulfobacillus thermosulfidooxidans TaxID=28034 RepID=A0A1W1WPD2_SULTA|nr:hypothetical protein [Sulfobacillus thermosulfidooxidans]PSR21013.1 MAG: hypothetical protein C7B47_17575 [Sulfobacillus thermosulfidooxidans]SMC08086.1 hypothetical protein SAMN00768000_3640 [Sulfobacillus thermosulfidooxidans DSM 9293]